MGLRRNSLPILLLFALEVFLQVLAMTTPAYAFQCTHFLQEIIPAQHASLIHEETPTFAFGRRSFEEGSPLPHLKAHFVRVYRGSIVPDRLQMSLTHRELTEKIPGYLPPSGESEFLSYSEAYLHAFGAKSHPDAVSVTIDYQTARGIAPYVLFYDIPQAVFERLPHGDRGQFEWIFKHSIPDKWNGGVIVPKTKP